MKQSVRSKVRTLFAASLLAALALGTTIGCGPGNASKIDTQGMKNTPAPGHDQAVEQGVVSEKSG